MVETKIGKAKTNWKDIPLIEKLKPLSLIRIKANLNPPTEKLIESDYHTDTDFKCKAAIYYVNDNDGYTMIGKEKILSKKNVRNKDVILAIPSNGIHSNGYSLIRKIIGKKNNNVWNYWYSK